MSKLISFSTIFLIIISSSLFGQVPSRINFQGVLMDNNGNPLSGSHNLEVKLFETGSGGSAIWTELHNSVPVTNGVFNIILGSVVSMNNLSFDKTYYAEVKVGNDPPLLPRVELNSTPYSIMTKNIENNTISTNKIQNLAVTTEKIADNSINSLKIIDGSITAVDIANSQVVKGLNSLKDNVSIVGSGSTTVTTSGNTITVSSTSGGGGTVTQVNTGTGLAGGPITTSGTISIPNNAITEGMLQNNSVNSSKILDGSITAVDIANSQVVKGLNSLKDNVSIVGSGSTTVTTSGNTITVSSTSGGGGTVTQVNTGAGLTGGPITNSGTISIPTGGVTSSMILDGTISAIDIGSTQVVKALNNLRDNISIVGAGSTNITTSGSTITVSSTGGSGTVTQVNTGAGLTGGPITSSGTISVPTNGITESMLQSNSVTSAKIVDGTISTSDIGSNAITTVKIQDQAVTGSKISVPLLLSAFGTPNVLSVMNTTGDAILTTVSTGTGIRSQVSGSGAAGRFLGGSSGTAFFAENSATNKDAAQIQSLASGGGSALYLWNNTSSIGFSTLYSYNSNSSGYGGYFRGRVHVDGILSKSSGTFRIDHPLDPANKYLNHSFVESPDMMNVYNGNVFLDGNGEAVVVLPNYFETLNIDFRYQLTPIGAPGPNLYVAQEINNNTFKIAGGSPNTKVSWQVTGIRNDPYAQKNRIVVEENKGLEERGKYLNPDVYDLPQELGITYQRMKEAQDRFEEERR